MLSGEKINLRLFRDEADVRAVCDAYNDLAERASTDHTQIYPVNKRIEKFRETGFWTSTQGQLLVTAKADEIVDPTRTSEIVDPTRTSEIVGTISFVQTTDFELEIGYRICRHKHRRKGFMSEALCLFSAYLFSISRIASLSISTAENTKLHFPFAASTSLASSTVRFLTLSGMSVSMCHLPATASA